MDKNLARYGGPAAILGGAMYVLVFLAVHLIYFAFKVLVAMAVFAARWMAGAAVAIPGAPAGVQAAVGVLGLLVMLAVPALFVAYYVPFKGRTEQTTGKRMTGIKVVRA